uniref:(California timema) hypothetical protein n=1 Tax=Timema californicum TaxID=61474 RepID=A0A7R9JKN7_TIMCA|nr:unnamed protein product [Timema californicum]
MRLAPPRTFQVILLAEVKLHQAAWNHHRYRLAADRVLSRKLACRLRAVSCFCRRVELKDSHYESLTVLMKAST